MKALVTGAAGFVGSVLCAKLLNAGHEVVAVDNVSRGLNAVWRLPGIDFVQLDCLKGIKEATQMGVDAVVHLAAGTGSLSRPIEQLRELNVEMTKIVYQGAVDAGASWFVYPTTSLTYGVPDSPYVKTKEEGMNWLLSLKPIATRVMAYRFFNVIGAYNLFTEHRKAEVHIIPTMFQKFIAGEPFEINGNDYDTVDGTPARDYVNVLDITEYIVHMLERGYDGRPHISGITELGRGEATTTLQMVDMFNDIVFSLGHKSKLSVRIIGRRAFDCGSLQCKDKSLTSYKPTHTVYTGLKAEIEAFFALKGQTD